MNFELIPREPLAGDAGNVQMAIGIDQYRPVDASGVGFLFVLTGKP